VVRSCCWDGTQARQTFARSPATPAGEGSRERWPKESPFPLSLASLTRHTVRTRDASMPHELVRHMGGLGPACLRAEREGCK
jgi:hypothetical protein